MLDEAIALTDSQIKISRQVRVIVTFNVLLATQTCVTVLVFFFHNHARRVAVVGASIQAYIVFVGSICSRI